MALIISFLTLNELVLSEYFGSILSTHSTSQGPVDALEHIKQM